MDQIAMVMTDIFFVWALFFSLILFYIVATNSNYDNAAFFF
jgi:hypothetical protein